MAARKIVEPEVVRTSYVNPAIPGKTPDRTVETPKRVYTVVGPKSVHGLAPGTAGELEITEGQALALIQGGHLVEGDATPKGSGPEDNKEES